MEQFNFRKWNTILGWATFAIALITYTLTVEPTMSFWDCGEYIATSAKLEVGHPPGAPLFQILGAVFAIFATDKEHIALTQNMLSVFSSAFTILFMFWSLTMLLRKVMDDITQKPNALMVLGASMVASLAFTFSDSFWFSAVETEVYAMASLFIAILFWLGLRWEQEMFTPRGNRWLLVISFIIGLSFGVHFMALLCIPSIGMLYYFKHYEKITVKNFIIANVVVVAVLLFIFKLLLPWTMALFGVTEVFMVNSFGLPFDSGTLFVAFAFAAFFWFGLRYTRKKGYVQANTLVLCILFILIGFSCWMMLPIRANADVVINENRPSDAREVLAYYNREQYGSSPLFYGPQFSDVYAGLDKEHPYVDKAPNYERDYKTGKYIITNDYKNAEQNGDDNHKAFLPRMMSTDHNVNYMNFTKPLEFSINPEYSQESELVDIVSEFRTGFDEGKFDMEDYDKFLKTYGDYLIVEKPTTADNLKFMFEYQFGYMYFRYLFWNFIGRQNDQQGKYDDMDGNWMSGIKFIDELHLGSQDKLPDDVKHNKGRNFYYFLPFLLALIGMFYHAKKDAKSFWVLMLLFLFTGLALKVYLNERPFEPRERDYALVGSFYVFAMWMAYGVYGLYDSLKSKMKAATAGPVVIGLALLAAPVLMAAQGWDDHDRSDRRTAVAMAKAYLSSCDKDAILFTIGDNDTFPLWYAQEIEGFRTDVRIVNTSLLMTDWYIDQMKRKAYESEPMPLSLVHADYVGDKLDYSAFTDKSQARWNLKDFVRFIKSRNPDAAIELRNRHTIQSYPTNKVRIPVNKEEVLKYGVVNAKFADSVLPYIDLEIKGGALYKNRLAMLDIVANNNWKRPIYFTGGSFGDDDYLWMKDYLQLDGMVYKLVPIRTPVDKENAPLDMGRIDADKMYDIVMKWDWGNGSSTKIYHDPETRKNSISYRTNLSRLADQLIKDGKKDKARKILDLAMHQMPVDYYGYYSLLEQYVVDYYRVGATEEARKLAIALMGKYQQNLTFYRTLKNADQTFMYVDIISDIERYRGVVRASKDFDRKFYDSQLDTFNSYNEMFARFGRDAETGMDEPLALPEATADTVK